VQRCAVHIHFKPKIRRPVLKLKHMAVIFPYDVITRIVRATSPGLSYMLIYLRRVAVQKRGSCLDLIHVTRRSRRFYDQGILRDLADSMTFLFEKTIQPPTALVDTTTDLIEFKDHRGVETTVQQSHFLTRKDNLCTSDDRRKKKAFLRKKLSHCNVTVVQIFCSTFLG